MASFGLMIVVGTWITTLLKTEFQMTLKTAGLLGSMVLLLGIVSRPLGGWLAHSMRIRTLIGVSLLLNALACAALAWGSSATPYPRRDCRAGPWLRIALRRCLQPRRRTLSRSRRSRHGIRKHGGHRDDSRRRARRGIPGRSLRTVPNQLLYPWRVRAAGGRGVAGNPRFQRNNEPDPILRSVFPGPARPDRARIYRPHLTPSAKSTPAAIAWRRSSPRADCSPATAYASISPTASN